jgi:hypothetical protein
MTAYGEDAAANRRTDPMAAAVAASPTGGASLSTAFEVSCSGVANNDATSFDSTKYPSEPQIGYYFKFALSGQNDIKSPLFSTNAGQTAEWHEVILPAAGSWTLTINKSVDDSVVATATVVAS